MVLISKYKTSSLFCQTFWVSDMLKMLANCKKNMSNCWYQFFKQECCGAEGAEVFHLYSHQGLLNLVILLSGSVTKNSLEKVCSLSLALYVVWWCVCVLSHCLLSPYF